MDAKIQNSFIWKLWTIKWRNQSQLGRKHEDLVESLKKKKRASKFKKSNKVRWRWRWRLVSLARWRSSLGRGAHKIGRQNGNMVRAERRLKQRYEPTWRLLILAKPAAREPFTFQRKRKRIRCWNEGPWPRIDNLILREQSAQSNSWFVFIKQCE